jgi:putative acetyltransferase
MVTIRPEQPGDAAAVRSVHEAAFPGHDEARLVDALRAAGRMVVSLVAEDNGRIVGHVAFSPVTVEGASDGVGLAPVAVIPTAQRGGIGSRLIRSGLDICRQNGFGFVVVLGAPAYYGRFGFTPAHAWGLDDEYGGGEAFQALELREGSIPKDAGRVRYAPEFAALDE